MVVCYGGGSIVAYIRTSHCTANLTNIIHMNGFVLLSDHVWEVPTLGSDIYKVSVLCNLTIARWVAISLLENDERDKESSYMVPV